MLKKRKKKFELTRINVNNLKNQTCSNCKYNGECDHINVAGFKKTLEDFCTLEKNGYDYFEKYIYPIYPIM